MQLPTPRSYWVIPGRFLAGCYPGRANAAESEQWRRAIVTCGIRSVVSLMEADEKTWEGTVFPLYDEELERYASELGESIVCRRFAIKDLGVPSHELMVEILDYLDAEMAAGRPVYVHCRGGIGRTGTVVGCWLARHGVASGEEIFHKIEALREHDEMRRLASPETAEQRRMVLGWKEGE